MVRRGKAGHWLTAPAVERPLARGRLRLRRLRRRSLTFGLAGAAALAAVATFAVPPPPPAQARATPAAIAEKDATRLAAWKGLLPEAPNAPPPEAVVPDGFVEREFARIAVVDGVTFSAGGLRLRLEGLVAPSAEEECRTLDGRQEPCSLRAATQLELITRFRGLSCRYRLVSPEEALGSCRVAGADLAKRLVSAGYVRRTPPDGGLRTADDVDAVAEGSGRR